MASSFLLFAQNLDAVQQSILDDCPLGYEKKFIETRVYCGCTYADIVLEVCCKWDINEHRLDYFLNRHYPKSRNSLCAIFYHSDTNWFNHFSDSIIAKHIEETCLDRDCPPCDHPTLKNYQLVYQKSHCWQKAYELSPPYPGEEPFWRPVTRKCPMSETYCVTIYNLCCDYSYQPPRKILQFVSFNPGSNIWCNRGYSEIPPDIISGEREEYWESECYRTPCR